MEDSIVKVLTRMESNIEGCKILSDILKHMSTKEHIDVQKYIEKGYSEEETILGIEIIDMYLKLHTLIEKAGMII